MTANIDITWTIFNKALHILGYMDVKSMVMATYDRDLKMNISKIKFYQKEVMFELKILKTIYTWHK